LIGDLREIRNNRNELSYVNGLGISEAQLRRAGATDSLRRKLVDWVSGLRDTELAQWQISLVALVMARRLALITTAKFKVACRDLPDYIRRVTYEDRIAPYRFFDPVKIMIELALEKGKLEFSEHTRHKTLVSEASSSAHEIGTTGVIKVGSTLINWQSAHGAHCNDKTKELCGRGFCLRYRLAKGSRIPKKAAAIEKLYLVLDGDFSARNVDHLIVAGWSRVFRSNQIDQLVHFLIGGDPLGPSTSA
jgi:hypothetical protein